MIRKALITGITGQVGSYLAEHLLAQGYEVHGLIRKSSTFSTERIEHIREQVKLHYFDLVDPMALVAMFVKVEPTEIYNLAAQSHVQVSFELPVMTGLHTGLAPLVILEALRISGLGAKFYQASSSELFGNAPPPQGPLTPISPRSPYAAAKAFAYWNTKIYREAYGLFAVNGILFNTESPRRSPTFVTRKITQGVARIRIGLQDKLVLGNLDAKRDWGFAGDYVVAIHRMMQYHEPRDWVVATGKSYSVREFLRYAIKEAHPQEFELQGEADWIGKHLVTNQQYRRPLEVDHLEGDARETRRLLFWEPTVQLPDLVKLMMAVDLDEAFRARKFKLSLA